jgi:tRNA-dihydrouridine synthase B
VAVPRDRTLPEDRRASAAGQVTEIHAILQAHLEDLYDFYGLETGFRVARKHIAWYTKGLVGSAAFRIT